MNDISVYTIWQNIILLYYKFVLSKSKIRLDKFSYIKEDISGYINSYSYHSCLIDIQELKKLINTKLLTPTYTLKTI